MKIDLDDKHILNSDPYCYWITKKIKSKTGKIREERVSGYHPYFDQVCWDYIDRKIRSSEATEIKQLYEEVRELKKTIKGWEKKNEQTKRRTVKSSR